MNSHPATTRTYALRSYIQCGICGHRMWGKSRRKHTYYVCERDRRQHLTEEWFRQHPAVWLRGDTVEDRLQQFFTERIFGPHRRALLEADLGELLRADSQLASARNEAETLQAEIDKLKCRQHRLIEELEVLDDDEASAEDLRELRAGIQRRFTDLGKQITAKRTELDALPPVPKNSALDDLSLIYELPTLPHKLDTIPEPLRRALYDAYNLQIHYHQPTRKLTVKVHVTGQALAATRQAVAKAQRKVAPTAKAGPTPMASGPRPHGPI